MDKRNVSLFYYKKNEIRRLRNYLRNGDDITNQVTLSKECRLCH